MGKKVDTPEKPQPEDTKTTSLAENTDGTLALPGGMSFDDITADASRGMENVGSTDIAIPFLQVLQALSPQLDETSGKYLADAKKGEIINSVTNERLGKSVKVVPCAFEKVYIEWKQRDQGGGLVNIHKSEAVLQKTKRNSRGQDELPNGNIIVTTAQHYCLLLDENGHVSERVVVGFSSTQLKKSRKWNSMIGNKTLTQGSKTITPPSFAYTYILSTTPESNEKGSWYGWSIEHGEVVSGPVYAVGRSFNQAYRNATLKVAPIVNDGAEPDPSGSGGDNEPEEF